MGKSGFRKYKPLILLAMGAILIGFWVYAACHSSPIPGHTIDVAGGIRAAVDKHIKECDGELRDFVEHAHYTVTVRKDRPLELLRLQTVTSDGSDIPEADLSNLQHVDVEVRAVWDGWFHKGGETIVAYRLLVGKDGNLYRTPFKVLRTTAKITRGDCE